jgi:hypothetical protein
MRRLNIHSILLCVVTVYVKSFSMLAEYVLAIFILRRQRIRTEASQKLNIILLAVITLNNVSRWIILHKRTEWFGLNKKRISLRTLQNYVYLGQRVKCRRITRGLIVFAVGKWKARGDAAFPLETIQTLRIPAITLVFAAWTTLNFFFPPTRPEEGPAGGQRRARPAPSVTLSSLPGQPDITPIFPLFPWFGMILTVI